MQRQSSPRSCAPDTSWAPAVMPTDIPNTNEQFWKLVRNESSCRTPNLDCDSVACDSLSQSFKSIGPLQFKIIYITRKRLVQLPSHRLSLRIRLCVFPSFILRALFHRKSLPVSHICFGIVQLLIESFWGPQSADLQSNFLGSASEKFLSRVMYFSHYGNH
jgi:hypothetical protein